VCDATFESGSGHVMRQITLGVALKSLGLNPVLFCSSIPEALAVRAHEFEIPVKKRNAEPDSYELAELIINFAPRVVVFDGYEFLQESITEVFDNGILVVLVDDNGELNSSPCHLFLNQNIHASLEIYECNSSEPKFLLGPQFTLIRQDVCQQIREFSSRQTNEILIAIGGTDIKSIGQSLTNLMLNDQRLSIISGSGFLANNGLNPSQLALAMSFCTIGIIGCGTTLWEAAYLGMPCIALVVADNQLNMANSAVQHEIAVVIDCQKTTPLQQISDSVNDLLSNKERRKQMSQNGVSLFDGKGAARVAQEITSLLLD
jgi:UDP-2,4-diacetamido-2,4,6-trideoxy-beta-L-altropyranose hydrolase